MSYLTSLNKPQVQIKCFISVFNQLYAQNLFNNKLVKHSDKHTEMHGQQNVKIKVYICILSARIRVTKNNPWLQTYIRCDKIVAEFLTVSRQNNSNKYLPMTPCSHIHSCLQ